MPFTILKTSRLEKDKVEVLGEFDDKGVADRFAGLIERDEEGGEDDNFDYTVESPIREPSSEIW